VLLDEDVRIDVKTAFAAKVQVHTVPSLGISGADDTFVIEEAVARKCLIVTANKDFVPAYRNHEWRKGRDRRYFWGLVFLKHSTTISQLQQLKLAIKEINHEYDDILTVSSGGFVTRERLDGRAPLPDNLKKRAARK
jgi:hypothetical protein